ncbi:MAG: phosphoribosylformylglycinamidine cyclo-ligase [Chloroflexi bacterium RBG_13_51_18]|nr:MAG: phosphoribosylformylglycinamidine cyclo-ligase [Chloroflexi bacterium RBG_13_51_18]
MKETYASAGVDIDLKSKAISKIGKYAKATLRPEVLSGVGFFGGLYEIKGYKNPVIISSVDGVGTKLKLASALNKYDTVGADIVNHCVNDIFTCGAEPIFFLDYIAVGKVIPERLEAIGKGLAAACKEVGCALIGGETAEMPGVYHGDDFDLVGFVAGGIEKDRIKMGGDIAAGDAILALPSNGLHTNGYSLARRVFGETASALNKRYAELGTTVGEALMATHTCYYNQLEPLLKDIKGLAHITGGGIVGNIPRSLPKGMAARLDSRTWKVPPILKLLQKKGNVDIAEMYRVFNMGIGMAVICVPEKVRKLTKALPESSVVGEVIKQKGTARVIIDGEGYRQDKVA